MPLPNWVMLEPFVSRRYGDDSFPDESRAPIRASGTTSWGATFTIAFSLAKPPRISRLYAQLPQFTYPSVYTPLTIVATHRHLSLFEVVDQTSTTMVPLQDLFVYSADKTENPTSSLRALPPCTEPKFDYFRSDGRLSHHPPSAPPKRRPLTTRHMGLLCRGEEEFAVAQLNLYRPSRTKVFADICLLRPCSPPALGPGDQLVGGRWKNMRLDVLCSDTDSHDDLLYFWDTDTIIPFQKWLCWIDYYRGILFCDLFRDPNPSVSFLRLPLDEFPSHNIRINTRSSFYRGAFVVDNGRALKFVNIARHDGIPLGALKPGTGFTITCHTLLMSHDAGGGMAWKVDYQVTSDELWRANHPDRLPRDILMHPQVDIDRPHVVHFLYIQWGCAQKKMWVVSIDMSTKIVESYSLYINGWEGLRTDNEDLIRHKSMAPMPFLPCEFPKFLHLSRMHPWTTMT